MPSATSCQRAGFFAHAAYACIQLYDDASVRDSFRDDISATI